MPWPLSPVPASSSSSSSSLGRPQTFVLVVAGFATIFVTYQVLNSFVFTRQSLLSDGLHRSNAVRRRHRAATNVADSSNDTADLQTDDWDYNEGIRLLMLDRAQMNGETENSVYHEEVSLNSLSTSQAFDRNGQNIVQLLFRVSEDASKRNAYVHRGCACNCCGMVPIRGIRYRCANCADYDLCESCEAQGVHIKTHIFYKIRVPASAAGPRTMQPVWYAGDPDSVTRQLPKETLVKLSRETGFERPELDAYWEQWTFMANTDWREDPHNIHLAMDRKTFKRCLVPSGHASPCLIFDRMFAFYDTNHDDLIGFAEFLHGITYRKKKDKWKKIFEGYDINGDGYVDRKDFLRMFRSYYVLYRTMHADILEGMVEQQMGSADAHRLVSSRQPLSSAFGQDGRFPRAPDPRTGEGKATLINGELEIIDGKGVINDNSLDHGDRKEVFKRSLPRKKWGEDRFHDRGYWEMMLSPPETTGQLTSMLRNIHQTGVLTSSNSHPALSASIRRQLQINDDENDNSEDAGSEFDDDQWPPNYIQVTDEDAKAVDGPGARVMTVQRSSRREVITHAILRLRTQREIYERWQRRNFYTDEEEGGTPPHGWSDSDDLLQNALVGENTQPSHLLNSSRSSSKVRFVENNDEFDPQPCPSILDRNIFDHRDAFEISDAEKDAGKEILYQVTQQAFNELLDPLFKRKEDIAIEAAATAMERKNFTHLYSVPEFEEWAMRQHESQKQQQKAKDLKVSAKAEASDVQALDETNLDQRLEKLLEAAGYKFSEERREQNSLISSPVIPVATNPEAGNNLSESQSNPLELPGLLQSNNSLNSFCTPSAPLGSQGIIGYNNGSGNQESLHPIPLLGIAYSESLHPPVTRDPTMPQFRPNRLPFSSVAHQNSSLQSENYANNADSQKQEALSKHVRYENSLHDLEEQPLGRVDINKDSSELRQQENTFKPISRRILYRYWLCNQAEKEAETRGGWGRIDLKEFEELVKSEVERERYEKDPRERDLPTRMDYLGSWIEFCIS